MKWKYTQDDWSNLEEFIETERLECQKMEDFKVGRHQLAMTILDYIIVGLVVTTIIVVSALEITQ